MVVLLMVLVVSPLVLLHPTSPRPPAGTLYLELSNARSMWWVATVTAAPETTTCAIAIITR